LVFFVKAPKAPFVRNVVVESSPVVNAAEGGA